MTYRFGIKVKSGIVGISDTRITSGHEKAQAKKVFTVNKKKHLFFIMTSGSRSVRDKALTYLKEMIAEKDKSFKILYRVVPAKEELALEEDVTYDW